MATNPQSKHIVQVVTDKLTKEHLKRIAQGKHLSTSALAAHYITKGLQEEPPMLGSIAEFEQFIVSAGMVGSPKQAQQVTQLATHLFAKAATRGPAA